MEQVIAALTATEALAQLNWNPLEDRFKYNESITMYKVMNELTPSYLKNRLRILTKRI